jgi:hypothetical protein
MHVTTRSKLAPPLSLDSVGLNFYLRDFEPGDLVVHPRDIAHYLMRYRSYAAVRRLDFKFTS